MIECIFTLDYEIYGNGEGSLDELIYQPATKLRALFNKYDIPLVVFAEAAELEMIEDVGADLAINKVKEQICEFRNDGFEIGLHLHPQWYNGHFEAGYWVLDNTEYNLCTLSQERISQIITRAISYLGKVLGEPSFTPVSFRAGNWLLQPTMPVVAVLAQNGIKVDSSVFKGGMRHEYGLDYTSAPNDAYYWKFKGRVDLPDKDGLLMELPIYTDMVPFWKMLNSKRVSMEKASQSGHTSRQRLNRVLDLLRFRHPLKLDFCRMTSTELTTIVEDLIRKDETKKNEYKPIVAIGHTKELIDLETVESFLAFLHQKGISVSTLQAAHSRCV